MCQYGADWGLGQKEKPLKINDFQRFFFFTPIPYRRRILKLRVC